MSVSVDEWLKQQGTTMRRGVDTSQMFVDKEQSESYAKYRMKYCDQVYQFIVDYCRETSPDLDLCVDCGCGPGQSTLGFAKYFKKVVGVDISEVQISNAPKHDNVEFKVGSAEKLPFIESGSVDLWSSAQSFNYMPEKE
ncbi:hypothetical protein EGW08_020949 [Elysia chlorotica]|uniref:Methyltransferase domain-containing protein n=1 Tax=Elysia chlorotica TaxID=188477 RepID=A0A3S1ASZ8_ELYCH|nr:hypothetical protein EGW08_020949 [Elysia chlorotica]